MNQSQVTRLFKSNKKKKMYKINENTMGSMKHIPFQYQMSRFIKTAADFKMPSARYFRNYKATILFVNS